MIFVAFYKFTSKRKQKLVHKTKFQDIQLDEKSLLIRLEEEEEETLLSISYKYKQYVANQIYGLIVRDKV